jgi:hypothetical protein
MNKKIIILAASTLLIGAAAAIAVVKPKKREDGSPDEPAPVPNGGGGFVDPCGGRAKNTSAFGLKVMALQEKAGITGCDKDGIVGPQTNAAVKAKFPALYASLGNVTASNIDNYLAGRGNSVELSKNYRQSVLQAVESGKAVAISGDIIPNSGNQSPSVGVYKMSYLPVFNQYGNTQIKTYVKNGAKFLKGEVLPHQDGIHLILKLTSSDIYAGNDFHQYVRILPKNIVIL